MVTVSKTLLETRQTQFTTEPVISPWEALWLDRQGVCHQFLFPFSTWPAYTQVFLVLANDTPVEDLLAVLHILYQIWLQVDFSVRMKCLLNKTDNMSILMKLRF